MARQILREPSKEMNQLLQKFLLNDEGRIQWDKLEQFVSISANADAALEGDFGALKDAQLKSDWLKQYGIRSSSSSKNASIGNMRSIDSNGKVGNVLGAAVVGGRRARKQQSIPVSEIEEKDASTISLSVLSEVFEFLLSENGRFLREPLVTEIAETIDSLGLTAAALASMMSNQLLPPPIDTPDEMRVRQFVKMVNMISSSIVASDIRQSDTENGDSSDASVSGDGKKRRKRQLSDYSVLLIRLVGRFNRMLSEVSNEEIRSIIAKAMSLMGDVGLQLLEKNAKRVAKVTMSPKAVKGGLATLSRILEILAAI